MYIGRRRIATLLGVYLVLSTISLCPAAEIHLLADAGWDSFNGELKLKSGPGAGIGMALPYSAYLELEGLFRLPFKYRINGPEGVIFSAGEYEKKYSALSHYSLTVGVGLKLKFKERQRLLPKFHLRFGRAWFSGGSKDGFSGSVIEYGAGLRCLLNESLNLEIACSRSHIELSRIEIGGRKYKMSGDLSENTASITLRCCYILNFSLPGWD